MMGIRDEIEKQGKDIERLVEDSEALRRRQHERADQLDAQVEALAKMAAELGVDIDVDLASDTERPERRTLPSDLAAAIGCLDEATQSRLEAEFGDSVSPTEPIDALDRFVIFSVGLVTPLAVRLRRGEKPPGFWDEIFAGAPLTAEKRRRVLIDWRRVNERWYGDLADVPSAVTQLGERAEEFMSNTEAGKWLAGSAPVAVLRELVAVLGAPGLDDLTGNHAAIATDLVEQVADPVEGIVRWLAKLMRDVAAPLGFELDEGLARRLLELPIPGPAAGRSATDMIGLAHDDGETVRSFLVEATVPAAIEGIVRLYVRLRFPDAFEIRPEEQLPGARLDAKYVRANRRDALLNSRLFWAHAVASGVNLGQVVVAGSKMPTFWQTIREIDVAEWQTFAAHTINRVVSSEHDTTVEQIVDNRRRIEARWAELLEDDRSTRQLYRGPQSDRPLLEL